MTTFEVDAILYPTKLNLLTALSKPELVFVTGRINGRLTNVMTLHPAIVVASWPRNGWYATLTIDKYGRIVAE